MSKLIAELSYNKPVPVGYFKTVSSRYCGKQTVIRYFRVSSNGYIITVDSLRKRISVIRSFGSIPYTLYKSNKRRFDKEFNNVLKYINKLCGNK